jgi:hypothetical protein
VHLHSFNILDVCSVDVTESCIYASIFILKSSVDNALTLCIHHAPLQIKCVEVHLELL